MREEDPRGPAAWRRDLLHDTAAGFSDLSADDVDSRLSFCPGFLVQRQVHHLFRGFEEGELRPPREHEQNGAAHDDRRDRPLRHRSGMELHREVVGETGAEEHNAAPCEDVRGDVGHLSPLKLAKEQRGRQHRYPGHRSRGRGDISEETGERFGRGIRQSEMKLPQKLHQRQRQALRYRHDRQASNLRRLGQRFERLPEGLLAPPRPLIRPLHLSPRNVHHAATVQLPR